MDVQDAGFSRGLGIGFGSIFPYLADGVRKDILTHIHHNQQLSLGLGTGLGMHISYLSKPLSLKIFEVAKNNVLFAMGLGKGCGIIFPYLSPFTSARLSTSVGYDGFAFGFGIGIGKIRKFLEGDDFEEAAALAKSINFNKGFAIGLGSVVADLSGERLSEILSGTLPPVYNASFAKNFGFGVGHIFSRLNDDKRKDILDMMRAKEEDFFAGLGEGLGHYLPSTGSALVEEVMQKIGSVNLVRGAAKGATESFIYLNLAEVLGMLEYARLDVHYGKVLGEGLPDKFVSLDEEKQSWILDAIQKESHFSRTFANKIQKNLEYLSPKMQERLSVLAAKFPHLEITLEKER